MSIGTEVRVIYGRNRGLRGKIEAICNKSEYLINCGERGRCWVGWDCLKQVS